MSGDGEPAAPHEVLAFWRAAGPERWFAKNAEFDADIRARFLPTCVAAAAERLSSWEDAPEDALALVLVLDQFPRNIFRDDARAYATDPLARAVARRAIARGFDDAFTLPLKRFFYMPNMHSEGLADQEDCIALCRAAGDEDGVKYAVIHADIIRRFNRFPHRNRVLGRTTTPEEAAFLAGGGFAG